MSVAPPSEGRTPARGTVLVTGAGGFTGRYLKEALEAAGFRHVGLSVLAGPAVDVVADLTKPAELAGVVREVRPNYVVHLAAVSFVGHEDLEQIYRINVLGATHLLDACMAAPDPIDKVVVASSANVYGVPAVEPVHEALCPAPVNHYGASKLAMECMAKTCFDRLPVIITRPFNYTGVGQDPRFVIPKLVNHFRDRKESLSLGDVSVVRDFSDVRDVAETYVRLLECPARGEVVNLCSGRGVALTEVLDTLIAKTGFRPKVAFAESLVRSAEIPRLVGSNQKLREMIGERPRRSLAETLDWMLGAP